MRELVGEACGGRYTELAWVEEGAYRRLAAGGRWRRGWLRCQMYLGYPLFLGWRALRAPRGSTFVVTSNTFYAPLLVAWLGRGRQLRVVHLLYDLFPDALVVAGKIGWEHWRMRAMAALARRTQRSCAGTVYLGHFLRRHAESQWGPAPQAAVIDISADARDFPDDQPLTPPLPLTVHYGGQLGHMHDAESLIHAVRHLLTVDQMREKVRFSFFISGSQCARLREALQDPAVEIRPTVPNESWRSLARHFPLGLVTLTPGGAAVCLPSKTYAMMAAGMAIIAICPVWSDLGRLVLDHDIGWVVSNSPSTEAPVPGSPGYWERLNARRPTHAVASDFTDLLRRLLLCPQEIQDKRARARRVMSTAFGFESLRRRWTDFLHSLPSAAPSGPLA